MTARKKYGSLKDMLASDVYAAAAVFAEEKHV